MSGSLSTPGPCQGLPFPSWDRDPGGPKQGQPGRKGHLVCLQHSTCSEAGVSFVC